MGWPTERNRLFFHERHRDIPGVNWIATVFHLSNCAATAGVDYPHPPNFRIGVSGFGHYFSLARVYFVLIDVANFTDDLQELAGLVVSSRQVNQFTDLELRGRRRLETAIYVVGIGNPFFTDKSGAVKVRCGGCLETYKGYVDRRIYNPGRVGHGCHG